MASVIAVARLRSNESELSDTRTDRLKIDVRTSPDTIASPQSRHGRPQAFFGHEKIFAKPALFSIYRLTNTLSITILTFAQNKKEFRANGCV
ncbi:MAG TPA: hypothetical protein VNA17_07900 [Pyrinomonadaceae bacterium]|nr:hypothetical protein [Pyrinomonadaceae bacterium]